MESIGSDEKQMDDLRTEAAEETYILMMHVLVATIEDPCPSCVRRMLSFWLGSVSRNLVPDITHFQHEGCLYCHPCYEEGGEVHVYELAQVLAIATEYIDTEPEVLCMDLVSMAEDAV